MRRDEIDRSKISVFDDYFGERLNYPLNSSTLVATPTSRIELARATWDTGWFQTEVVKQLLEELGYKVDPPQTKENLDFYTSTAVGKTDLWVNGWFPLHNSLLAIEGVAAKVETIGNLVKGQVRQGYLLDRPTAQKLKITNLGALAEPKVAEIFDRNGNGKADLIGCNRGWACAEAIDYQLDAYGLGETVEQIQGDYTMLMKEAVTRYRQGEPLLFYTWMPNWTISSLIPGKDVVWLEVPSLASAPGPENLSSQRTFAEVNGCTTNPCPIGFPATEIKAVANKKFLATHSAARKLLELLEIPLEDIVSQNSKMVAGEDEEKDIRRHAREWIEQNRERVDLWLKLAKDTKLTNSADNSLSPEVTSPQAVPTPSLQNQLPQKLRVVTKRFEPFVTYENGEYLGFSMDLWAELAQEWGIDYEIYGVNSIAKLLDEIKRGAADVGIAGISITAGREQELDFSHPYYLTGLQIMVLPKNISLWSTLVANIQNIVTSRKLYYGLGIFLLILLSVAHIMWFFERDSNPEFPKSYGPGIWESLWWVAVTVTTVGYGDKTPKGWPGRLFGLLWMFAGYFVLAYFIATVTTSFTLQNWPGRINGPEDLPRVIVATVKQSAAAEYLQQERISSVEYDTLEETYLALQDGEVDAIVYDAPALNYYASHQGKGKVKVVGPIVQQQYYGIALALNSPYRQELNIALLAIMENGSYKKIHQNWFGNPDLVLESQLIEIVSTESPK